MPLITIHHINKTNSQRKEDLLDSYKGKISTETSVGTAFSIKHVYFIWNIAFIAKDQQSPSLKHHFIKNISKSHTSYFLRQNSDMIFVRTSVKLL